MANQKVLVTGANGFVAAHVVEALLQRGYQVRGTVRSQQKADQILAKYPQYKGKLEVIVVGNLNEPGVFKGTLDGISGVFHVATAGILSVKVSNKVDILDPAIEGTLSLLREVAKHPQIKRVVITSSVGALLDPTKGPGHVITEKDWNPIPYEYALTTPNPVEAYIASKTFAEKAAFDFVKDNKPHFDIVTITPPMVQGPVAHHVDKLDDLGGTPQMLYNYIVGKATTIEPPLCDVIVDVRDLALGHILAFESPKAANQRYLISGENFNMQQAIKGQPGAQIPPVLTIDNSKSKADLGITYRPKEETFHDFVAQVLKLQKEGK